MKKVLSIMLAVMMLASLFAANVSAAVIETTYTVVEGAYDETVFVSQDYSDMEANTAFAPNDIYGKQVVEDGIINFTGMSSGGTINGTVQADVDITSDEYEMTFDLRRNHTMTKHIQMYVIFQRAQNAENADNNLKKYGVVFPVQLMDEDVWYNFKIVVSESGYAANGNDLASLAQVYYKKATDEKWSKCNLVGSWSPSAFTYRCFEAGSRTAGATEDVAFYIRNYYGVKGNEEDLKNTNLTQEEADSVSVSVDNVLVHIPENAGKEVVYDYPFVKGTMNLTKTEELELGAYAGGNANPGQYVFTTKLPVLEEGDATRCIIYTFDAINTVKGMPICIHIGGSNLTCGFDILSTDEILNKWYTYKVVVYETYGNSALSINTIARKPADGSGDWEVFKGSYPSSLPEEERNTIPVAGWWNNYDITSAKFHVRGSLSGTALNMIRLVWRSGAESLVDADVTDLTATKWSFRNQQVVTGAYATGFATVADGVLTVDADFTSLAPATHVLAVYDESGRMIDADFAPFAAGTGDLELSADYVDGNKAMIFFWKEFGGKDFACEPWDITADITK